MVCKDESRLYNGLAGYTDEVSKTDGVGCKAFFLSGAFCWKEIHSRGGFCAHQPLSGIDRWDKAKESCIISIQWTTEI